MRAPEHAEGRPPAGAAPSKVWTDLPPSVPTGVDVAPRPSALALSHAGPSCPCGDWSRGYAAGAANVAPRAYADGHAAGLAEGLAAGPAHPAVAESVARMFGPWDGAAAAAGWSVTRFRQWHAAQREGVAV